MSWAQAGADGAVLMPETPPYSNVPENLSVDQLSNRSLKSRTERMAKKLSTCVANQRGPFFHSTWAYDFILEKREKKGHIFVRDQ